MSQAGIAGGGSGGGGGGRIITTLTTFAPNATLQEFDDFLSAVGFNAAISKLQWNFKNNNFNSSVGTTTNPGIMRLTPTAGVDQSIFFEAENNNNGPIVLGGGITTINWVIRPIALSGGGNTYILSCGLVDLASADATGTFVDGVYFQYTDTVNGGQWQLKSTNTSVTTTVNTTVAATTNFTTFSIVVNAGATSVSYYINGSLVGTAITTNIPTASLVPVVYIDNTAGTSSNVEVDLFWITINLTTARAAVAGSSTIVGTGMLIEQYVQTAVSYQVLNTDAIIGVSSTAAPRTITMPASSLVTGQRWTVKDESGGAAANNITISGNGKNIDGAATKAITTNYGAVDIYYNGSNFFLI